MSNEADWPECDSLTFDMNNASTHIRMSVPGSLPRQVIVKVSKSRQIIFTFNMHRLRSRRILVDLSNMEKNFSSFILRVAIRVDQWFPLPIHSSISSETQSPRETMIPMITLHAKLKQSREKAILMKLSYPR